MSEAPKLVMKHTFAVKPSIVFEAWTSPVLMSKWFDGGAAKLEDVVAKDVKVDLRVGGKFELKMTDTGKHHYGEYREIKPYDKLVFTWNSPFVSNTLVTLELKPNGNKTDLTLTHELLPTDQVEGHRKGWTKCVGNLDSLLKK